VLILAEMEATTTPYEKLISVLGPRDALSWYPSATDEFFEVEMEGLPALKEWIKSLDDGSTLPVRGRDWSGPYGKTC
jgi:hypothetical protein